MEFKVSEKNVHNSISAGLNREYKGKIVKINYQDFKNTLKNLKLQYDRNNFEEFRAEIKRFTEGVNGALYVELYILDIILYDYYRNGTGVFKNLSSLFLPLEKVKDRYVYNKISSLVMVDYYDRKIGQLHNIALSGDKQAVKKFCNELASEIIKDEEEIKVDKVEIMKGVWKSIGHVNFYYFGEQLHAVLNAALRYKTTNDRDKKFTLKEFEEDIQSYLYKWVINEYMLNEDIL